MIRTTRWRPDTCGCVVTFSWDDRQPAEDRVHVLDRAELICPEHKGLPDTDVYEAIVAENATKNLALAEIQSALPRLVMGRTLPDGTTETVWAPGVNPAWSLGGKDAKGVREVVITILAAPHLTLSETLAAANALAARRDIKSQVRLG